MSPTSFNCVNVGEKFYLFDTERQKVQEAEEFMRVEEISLYRQHPGSFFGDINAINLETFKLVGFSPAQHVVLLPLRRNML